jgi:hypothetical protein
MKKIIAVLTAVVVALFASISWAAGASAETKIKTYKLKVYSVSEAPILIGSDAEGTTVGDIRHRTGVEYRTLAQARTGKKSLGRGNTIATVVDEDLDKQTDLRSVTGHTNFHDGSSITFLGSSVFELGKVPVRGQGHTFVVVGGTGKYFGAEGTMTTRLVDVDKLIFRRIYKLIKE